MPGSSENFKFFGYSYLLASVVAAVFMFLAYLPPNQWWGINHLAYLPGYIKIIFVILALSVFLPPVAKRVLKTIDKFAPLPKKLGYPLAAISAIAIFTFFRITVHSMGDSYVRANEIKRGLMYLPSEFLDFLLHAVVYRLVNLFMAVDAIDAIALTSIIIGGIFVPMVIKLAPLAGRSRSFLIVGIFSLGSSLLFFGYVESYTLLYLFVLWYILLVFRQAPDKPGWAFLTILYLLAGLSHQAGMILLLPSYWYLSIQRFKNQPARLIKILAALIISLMPFAVIRLVNFLIGYQDARSLTDYILPLHNEVYAVFSPIHLFDIANLFLLAAPIAVILIPILIMRLLKIGDRWLVATFIAPSLLFIVAFNSDLTLVRDWDLFSTPVAVMVVPLLIIFFRMFSDEQPLTTAVVPVVLIPVILFCAWVVVNNRAEAHLNRAEYLLDHTVKGQRYGYENLAHYFNRHGCYEDEVRVLMKIKAEDRTPRVYGQISMALWFLGRKDEAYDYAMEGLNSPRPREINALMAGLTSFDKGLYIDAINFFQAYLRLNPTNRDIMWKMGEALLRSDSTDLAIKMFSYMKSTDKNDPLAFFGLARAYYQKGAFDSAETYCQQGLKLNPHASGAQELMQTIRDSRQESHNDSQ